MQSDVMAAIAKMKLVVPVDEAAVKAACEAAVGGTHSPVVIARGALAVPGTDGRLIWSKNLTERAKQTGQVSHYVGRMANRVVKTGEPLVKLVPEAPGTDGKDIYGKVLKAPKGKALRIHAGANIREDQGIYFALKDGLVTLVNGKIRVDEIFVVEDNLTFEVGNVDFPGSVIIRGGVLDLFEVKAGASIEVDGLVEGANLTAGGDIEVQGGIAGKKKGVVRCRGTLTTKFLVNAEVYAGKDVCVETQIVTSKVMVHGAVKAPEGAIAGGEVSALGGIDAETIGSESGTKTVVTAGINYTLAGLVAKTEATITEARKELAAIEKELNSVGGKDLTPEARERIGVLEAKRAEANDRIAAADKRRNDEITLTRDQAHAVIVVRKTLHPGVVVRLGDCRVTIDETINGPVKLVPDRTKNIIRFVATGD
jgi:uncharacterized protein (DUF342 family)